MTTPSSNAPASADLATEFFQRRVEAITSAALARVSSEIEGMGSTPEGEALFMSFERDPRALELFGADMALKQIVEVFKALFSADLSAEDALAAGAARGPAIEIELTGEARAREYREIFPALAPQMFPEGAPVDLPPTLWASQTFIFSDGSALSISQSDPDSTRVSSLILSQARSLSDVIGEPGSRTSELARAFDSMTQQIRDEILSQSEHLTAGDIKQRSDDVSFRAIRSILSAERVVAPMNSLSAMANSLCERMTQPSGQWLPGVAVRLDSQPLASREALLRALPTPELDASLQADALIAQARSKPRGPGR